MPDRHFYQELAGHGGSLRELLAHPEIFKDVPTTWAVIVTDIKGSTKAIDEGRYREVNTIAASCVIACLNVAKREKVEMAFFYGGDGATLLVPTTLCPQMLDVLQTLRGNVFGTYGLPLRVGSVSMKDVYAAGKQLRIAKWAVSSGYHQAIFLGDGLGFADSRVKNDATSVILGAKNEEGLVDLQGLSCRWNEIKPPADGAEVVCLIVQAMNRDTQGRVYEHVLGVLDEVYGTFQARHPIRREALSPSLHLGDIKRASALSMGKFRLWELVFGWIRAVWSTFVFWQGRPIGGFDPARYLFDMAAATNVLHVSGTLYTVMMGMPTERAALRARLDVLEATGDIRYGLAACPASVVTCYVQKYDAGGHIHFLDGAGGGYTQAAKEIKAKPFL